MADSIVSDAHRNEKIVHELREQVGIIDKPDSKFVTKKSILITDDEGNIIEKDVFIDDKRNVVPEK